VDSKYKYTTPLTLLVEINPSLVLSIRYALHTVRMVNGVLCTKLADYGPIDFGIWDTMDFSPRAFDKWRPSRLRSMKEVGLILEPLVVPQSPIAFDLYNRS
jgi:hypothetical protein